MRTRIAMHRNWFCTILDNTRIAKSFALSLRSHVRLLYFGRRGSYCGPWMRHVNACHAMSTFGSTPWSTWTAWPIRCSLWRAINTLEESFSSTWGNYFSLSLELNQTQTINDRRQRQRRQIISCHCLGIRVWGVSWRNRTNYWDGGWWQTKCTLDNLVERSKNNTK
jgi:hypothetical protein